MNFAPIELFTLVHTLPLSFLELVGGDACSRKCTTLSPEST